ncbi:MAG TPA: hypothetical protein VKM93_04955 [Terriglobia bacterium]|nr:hypothetical protein [Terriglobia bacterium]
MPAFGFLPTPFLALCFCLRPVGMARRFGRTSISAKRVMWTQQKL